MWGCLKILNTNIGSYQVSIPSDGLVPGVVSTVVIPEAVIVEVDPNDVSFSDERVEIVSVGFNDVSMPFEADEVVA